jgi:hypothetical protein
MKVTISKGPHFEEVEKKVYQYLHKVLSEKANQNERKGA